MSGFRGQRSGLPPPTGVKIKARHRCVPSIAAGSRPFLSVHPPHGVDVFVEVSAVGTILAETGPARREDEKVALGEAEIPSGAPLRNASKSLRRDSVMPSFFDPNSIVIGMQKASTCVVLPCHAPPHRHIR